MKTPTIAGWIIAGVVIAGCSPPPPAVPTVGTEAMALRLDGVVGKWEAAPYSPTEEKPFRANRPGWIPAYRQRIASSQKVGKMLEFRHRLARELLWDGQTKAALGELNRLSAMVEQSTAPERVKESFFSMLRTDFSIGFLRLAEQENCLAGHNPQSCIFPIREAGVHRLQEPSSAAIGVLLKSLAANPDDLGSRWLLNLAYMTLGKYPQEVPPEHLIDEKIFQSEHDPGRFRDEAAKLGVAAVGLAGGCCVDDFDGDGDLDIVASSWGLRDQLRLFSQNAEGGFDDRTLAAGLSGEVGGLNICHADYDNDGALDLLVLRGGWLDGAEQFPNSLLRNLGGGVFDDVTEKAGLLSFSPTQVAAWGDYDNDGFIDLFIGNESNAAGSYDSRLYHNNGDGTFTEQGAASGLSTLGFVKGAAWGDYDNDGFIDLYISRAGAKNLLFHNEGRESPAPGGWSFKERAASAGVEEPVNSFPAWFWDYDNDGWLDLFVAGFDGTGIDGVAGDYLGRPRLSGHPKLYRNRGDGTFDDVTSAARLDRVLLVMGANFGDLDNDGHPDLYLGTGAPDYRTLMPNRMFRNNGNGAFQDVTTAGGFGHLQKGHGIAFADVDADGDQDVYAVMGGWYTGDVFPNVLFENPGHGNHWITLRLRGTRANRSAIGARVKVTVRVSSGSRQIHALAGTGGSFGSASLQQEIGLGKAEAIEEIEIWWPGQEGRQVFRGPEMDRAYLAEEGATMLQPVRGGDS